MTAPAWIGADWGTTNLRVWAMSAAGEVLAEHGSAQGMGSLAPGGAAFEPALMALIDDMLPPGGPTPVVICGMAGARQGWAEAAYAAVPCPPGAAAPMQPAPRDPRIAVRILGGLSQTTPPDVMRGEETQIAGLLATEPAFSGTVCLPGTHTKWAQIARGQVTRFQTCMTGEVFALLARHSILRHSLGDGWDDDAYLAAVALAATEPGAVATQLFAIRAAGLLAAPSPATATAQLSGLLIGLELAATRAYWSGGPVVLIGTPALADRYAAALVRLGTATRRCDAGEMTRRGLAAARERWSPPT